MERILDLSDEAASLSVRYNQLVIRRGERQHQVPLEELSALIVAHPAVHYTHAVLAGVCEHGGAFILCDSQRLPAGMLLPISTNHLQTERLAAQVRATLPTKKRAWKQIVVAKVNAQAGLLEKRCGCDRGLKALARRVQSGDIGNIEAQASQRYWPALFGPAFRRAPSASDGINSILNYGYAVLRALIARGICASGLHPSLGIHHHNRYDTFCLASDLMEPFRPIVDSAVALLTDLEGEEVTLHKHNKAFLINRVIEHRFRLAGRSRHLSDIAVRLGYSLVAMYAGKRKGLALPKIEYD
jgi:CRISPR-associated protein Cas1